MLGIFRFKNIFRVKGARGVLWVKVYNWKNGNLFIFSLLSNGNSFFFISFIIYTILNPFCLFGHSRAFYELTLLFFSAAFPLFPALELIKLIILGFFCSLIMCLIMLWLTLDCSTHHLSLSAPKKIREASRNNKMFFFVERNLSNFFNSILPANSAPNFSFFIKQMKFVLFFPLLFFHRLKTFSIHSIERECLKQWR